MKPEADKIPMQTRMGALSFGIAAILFLVFENVGWTQLTQLITVLLFFGGLVLAVYGLTKVHIKGDKGYERFIRAYNKWLLVFFFIPIIIYIFVSSMNYPSNMVIISLIIFAILCVIDVVLSWIFYAKVYKHIKKIYKN